MKTLFFAYITLVIYRSQAAPIKSSSTSTKYQNFINEITQIRNDLDTGLKNAIAAAKDGLKKATEITKNLLQSGSIDALTALLNLFKGQTVIEYGGRGTEAIESDNNKSKLATGKKAVNFDDSGEKFIERQHRTNDFEIDSIGF